MFVTGAPSTPSSSVLGRSAGDSTSALAQVPLASQIVHATVPPSATVGNLTFAIGRVMTALSDLEKIILEGALHTQTFKQSLGDLNDNRLLTYVITVEDFAPVHLWQQLPQQMMVTCALDQSLNLQRVLIADLDQRPCCDARFEPAALPESTREERDNHSIMGGAAGAGSIARTASSPAVPPAVIQPPLHPTQALFSAAARGRGLTFIDPLMGTLETPPAKIQKPSDSQIIERLKNSDGSVRNRGQVMNALRLDNFEVSGARITPLLQQLNGLRSRPRASDEQILNNLRDANGDVRTALQVAGELRNAGVGADTHRIATQLQSQRGLARLPTATDTQILEHLYRADGTLQSAEYIAQTLNATGVGASHRRIKAVGAAAGAPGQSAAETLTNR
jgi:hypothetical protein